MADGFKIEFTGEEAAEVAAAAKAHGLSVEEYVRGVLQVAVSADSQDLNEDISAAEEFDRTGVGVPWDEVAAWLTSLATDNPLPRPTLRKLS